MMMNITNPDDEPDHPAWYTNPDDEPDHPFW
jgi:hypothetical protein